MRPEQHIPGSLSRHAPLETEGIEEAPCKWCGTVTELCDGYCSDVCALWAALDDDKFEDR